MLVFENREIVHVKNKESAKNGLKSHPKRWKNISQQKFWATKKLVSENFSHIFDRDENVRELIISTLR